MRRIVLLSSAAVAAAAMWALSVTAPSRELVLVEWRWLPSFGWTYCDSFYDSDNVYWCHDENYGGYWFKVSPTY